MTIEPLIVNLFLALLVIACAYDAILLRIPNVISAVLLGLFFVAAMLTAGVDWISHIGAGLAVFVVGAALFHFRIFGGGDVKLLAVGAVWTGIYALPFYLLAVALIGGVVALFFWGMRKALFPVVLVFAGDKGVKLPQVLVEGEGVPYGVAIAAGLAATAVQTPLWHGEINVVFLKYFGF